MMDQLLHLVGANMKLILVLLFTITSFNAFSSSTWSYQVVDGGKESPEYKLDSTQIDLKVNGANCLITPTTLKNDKFSGMEFRSVSCKIGKYFVYTNIVCRKDSYASGTLHLEAKTHAVILVTCQP